MATSELYSNNETTVTANSSRTPLVDPPLQIITSPYWAMNSTLLGNHSCIQHDNEFTTDVATNATPETGYTTKLTAPATFFQIQ